GAKRYGHRGLTHYLHSHRRNPPWTTLSVNCINGTWCTIPRIVICLSRIALETTWRFFPRWMRRELARRTPPEPVALIFRPTAKSSGSAPSRTDRRDRCRQPTARQYFSIEWDHSLFQYRFRPA